MNANYFESYEDLHVHKLMLNDYERIKSYKEAILSNSELFCNSVILDIGAGSGILSIFAAQAGARKVYSVEAASSLVPIIQNIVAENQFSEIIQVIDGEIESIELEEKVDIIISEWMGFFLLHEGMLDSILFAKKFLKENGIIFPEECSIFLSLCEVPDYFDKWNNVQGVKMTSFGKALREVVQHKPDISYIDKKLLLSKPLEIVCFKPISSDLDDFKNIIVRKIATINRAGKYQGVCLWFHVKFPTPSGNIILSTSPFDPATHWKQTIIVLPSEMIVEESEPVAFEISFNKNGPRTYQIAFSMLEADEVQHPSPCDCFMTKCKVIKAFMLENIDNPS